MTPERLAELGFVFDERAADFAVGFVEDCCVHVKGRLAGERFELLPWERHCVRELFGWKRADGTRRYRIAYISVPRKNGKSSLGYCIALLLLVADGEPGAEVYSAAGDREQAGIVFDMAKRCVQQSDVLASRVEVFRHSIVYSDDRVGSNVYKALSADAYRHHGLNAHGVIFDELHVQKTRELWDVLETSVGARTQPLIVALTTAGVGTESICAEQYGYAKQVLEGVIEDPTFFAYIAEAARDADWTQPEVWAAANPSLGVAVMQDYIAERCERAKRLPAFQNTFRRLQLNQWTQATERAIDLIRWDEAGREAVPLEQLEADRVPCYGGLDLASTRDLSALVLVWPVEDFFYVWPVFWLPEAWKEEQLRYQVPFDAWVRDGFVRTTPGEVIDQEQILFDMLEVAERYNLVETGIDRYHAEYIDAKLEGEELEIVAIGQGYGGMSNPTSDFLALYKQRRLRHGGHPVLRWMADNFEVRQDPAGNLKPDRSSARQKIDGIVALIMALDRALRLAVVESVYDSRGIDAV